MLGAAILSVDARAGMVDQLQGDDFDREAHRQVFVTLAEMHEAEVHVDQITLSDALVGSGRIDVAGGLATSFDLASMEGCPNPAAWRHYVSIVRREGYRRRLIRACRRALDHLAQGHDVASITSELAPVVSGERNPS